MWYYFAHVIFTTTTELLGSIAIKLYQLHDTYPAAWLQEDGGKSEEYISIIYEQVILIMHCKLKQNWALYLSCSFE